MYSFEIADVPVESDLPKEKVMGRLSVILEEIKWWHSLVSFVHITVRGDDVIVDIIEEIIQETKVHANLNTGKLV